MATAELGDKQAKYMKGYYIQQKLININLEQAVNEKLVAGLYKEAADSGDAFTEAQLRYGGLIFKGIGVQKDLKEAALYFTKAAENGQVLVCLMQATLYITGGAGENDTELGTNYMRLAAYKQHRQANDYCKKITFLFIMPTNEHPDVKKPVDGSQKQSSGLINAEVLLENTGAVAESTLNLTSAAITGAQSALNLAVPFVNFLPLITEVAKIYNEIVEIYQAAEHNKKICGILLDRVQVADADVKNLKNRRDENVKFFSEKNLFNLNKLLNVIVKIRKFVEEISQLKGLKKYIQAKNIEKRVNELMNEFDSTIQLLQFSLMVDFSINADKDNKDIKADVEDLNQYLKDIGSGITDVNQNVSEIVVQINALHTTVNQMAQANSPDQSDVFQSELLEYNDFEEEGKPIENQNVRKFRRKKLNDYVALKLVADQSSTDEQKANFKRQVTILKKLKECHFILQFHGLSSYDDKFYLVTEWADFGNLREYYHKYSLDVKLKLRFALDIARGLNFLSAVSIVHRDIRADNILITDHETAKIANFKSSRAITDSTQNQNATLEAIRYCAPEKLTGKYKYKYDTKCEVYSFGILLWEIAEGKIPLEKFGEDILAIQEQVCIKNYRETFSLGSLLPKEYRELAEIAVHHDHNFRPQFSKIFTILQDLHTKGCRPTPSPQIYAAADHPEISDSFKLSGDEAEDLEDLAITSFKDFNYMTVDEAAIQHKLSKGQGNCESAYKCFEAYAELGDIKAKYMKGYYIQQKL
ncbi:5396_t:CDS:2, partial [Funneliformis geosporum]